MGTLMRVSGRSKESQKANSLELMRLQDQISRWDRSDRPDACLFNCNSVLDWRHLRRPSVEEAVHPPRLVRFGTFEVDLPAGELRKGGLKLKLTGQPFQVLAILLERPGELVTREELQKRLWPDTFVDVDHNLNAAINKIREVLGDSAETPRFVETVPRRGYRFIAPVNGNAASSQTNVVLVTSGSSFVADRPGGASFRFLPVLAILLSIVAVTLV